MPGPGNYYFWANPFGSVVADLKETPAPDVDNYTCGILLDSENYCRFDFNSVKTFYLDSGVSISIEGRVYSIESADSNTLETVLPTITLDTAFQYVTDVPGIILSPSSLSGYLFFNLITVTLEPSTTITHDIQLSLLTKITQNISGLALYTDSMAMVMNSTTQDLQEILNNL